MRIFFTIILLTISCSIVCGSSRHGLIIGLGEYKDNTWSKIHGDRDVEIIRNMLSDCGYTDIKTLINREATKDGILAAFRGLSDRCRIGDVVYIHFSGHGQRITDVNGDEDDGWDEAWVPYDAMFAYSRNYKGEKHLIDDEIALWMTRIINKIGPSGRLLVVVDACHSGDSSREDNGDEEIYVRGADKDFIIPMETAPARTVRADENWLTLTACRNYQTNCEVRTTTGGFYGMLSCALYKEYGNLSNMDNEMVMSQLQMFVNRFRHDLPQDITLTGSIQSYTLTEFFK